MSGGAQELGLLYGGQYASDGSVPAASRAPVFSFRFSPSTGPFAAPVWEDLTPYVVNFSWKRGRNFELNRIDAGSGQVTLDNSSRRFDPTNPNSPYYPNLVPLKQFQVLVTFSNTTWEICTGFIEDWPLAWDGPGWGEVDCNITDGFDFLAAFVLNDSWAQELSGTRIGHVLTDAGVPSSMQLLDAGANQVVTATFTDADNEAALSHIQDVTVSEDGYLFVDGAGNYVFHDQSHRTTSLRSTQSQATFGDDTALTELEYVDLEPSIDRTYIYNQVAVTPSGSTTAEVAIDTASQAAYGTRILSLSTLVPDAPTATALASRLLSRYKDPHLRFKTMTVQPLGTAAFETSEPAWQLWQQVLAREIGDRITVCKRPPDTTDNSLAMTGPQELGALYFGQYFAGTGAQVIDPNTYVLQQDCFIEQIEWNVNPGDLDATVSYVLSPAI